jgi:hypothetical protein
VVVSYPHDAHPITSAPADLDAAAQRIVAAWRRQCPDIRDGEAIRLAAIVLDGPTARTALNAYRAGRVDGYAEGTAARPRGQQIYRIPADAPNRLDAALGLPARCYPEDGSFRPITWERVHAAVQLIDTWRERVPEQDEAGSPACATEPPAPATSIPDRSTKDC